MIEYIAVGFDALRWDYVVFFWFYDFLRSEDTA